MCQIQTAFWSCGQLAEGRTVLCHSYQHTKGRYCDGFSSFSRPVKAPCPNCQAGIPHPPSQQMSAAVQTQRCVRPAAVPTPSSAANVVTAPTPETGKPADGGNTAASRPGTSATPPTGLAPPITVTPPENDPATSAKRAEVVTTTTASETIWPPPTILAPPAAAAPQKGIPADSAEPARSTTPHGAASETPAQALSEMERTWRKLTPKAVPVPARISTAGAIKKPSVAPAARRQPRALAPKAKMVAPVAQMVAPPGCPPAMIASSSSGMKAIVDPASLWRDLSGVSRAADVGFPLDPALRGV